MCQVVRSLALTGGGVAVDGLANVREAAAAQITRSFVSKGEFVRMDFHSERHFEVSHLQMPSPSRTLTGLQGGWISPARLQIH